MLVKDICKYYLMLSGQPAAASSVCMCALTAGLSQMQLQKFREQYQKSLNL